MTLPAVIADKIGAKEMTAESIGRSGAEVYLLSDKVLKIEETGDAPDREYTILKWLENRLPSPRVMAFARENGKNYLLMSKLPGIMACDTTLDPSNVTRALAEGLKMLWQVDISDCPVGCTVKTDAEAVLAYEAKDDELRACIEEFRKLPAPTETEPLVFSHGDYCLPNVFLQDGRISGFLDLGGAGIADKWYDIAVCLWSMNYNFKELGGMSEEAFAACRALLFRELGIFPNEEKLHYYDLLDECFMRMRNDI